VVDPAQTFTPVLIKLNSMKKCTLSILMWALMLIFVACGNKDGREDSTEAAEDQNEEKFENSKPDDDTEFVVEAADDGLLEVQLGTLALTKAASPEVKQFAQMMVDDHTKANNELKALAQQKNISLTGVLGNENKRKYDNFNEKTGTDFDKEYMDRMVKDHREVINEFEEQAEDGNDAELKSWANGKLTVLRHHLEVAERTQESVKKNNNR
jgi:putative membrane protein